MQGNSAYTEMQYHCKFPQQPCFKPEQNAFCPRSAGRDPLYTAPWTQSVLLHELGTDGVSQIKALLADPPERAQSSSSHQLKFRLQGVSLA